MPALQVPPPFVAFLSKNRQDQRHGCRKKDAGKKGKQDLGPVPIHRGICIPEQLHEDIVNPHGHTPLFGQGFAQKVRNQDSPNVIAFLP